MNSFLSTPIRCSLLLLVSALLVSGCSSSSDSSSTGTIIGSNEMVDGTTAGSETDSTTGSEGTAGSETESTTGTSETEEPSATRVNFDITVPAVISDALQVRLVWGGIDTTAMWNSDELWTASVDFPVSTTNQLVVTFSDGNGTITLGSVETSFTTGDNPSESFQIAADEFDTDRWDSDGDGVSNLSETFAGTNPQGSDALEPVQASLEFVQDKTFRLRWQSVAGAQFYRVLENPNGISGFTDVSGDLEATATTFDHRVALYARVNAQYLVQSCNDQECVDSEPVLVTGTLVSAIGYLKASNSDENNNFGGAVSLSADGNTLAVGAIGENGGATGVDGDQNDNSAFSSGAVYVFVRNREAWQQQAYVKASNTDNLDRFGGAVSLSADGNTLAVGANSESGGATGVDGEEGDNSAERAGAAYVFTRTGSAWSQQAYLKASNTGAEDAFGNSVSLSADGNMLAVGAVFEDSAATGVDGDQADNSARSAGAVYVFTRTGNAWAQQSYLKASNTDEVDLFGQTVSFSADGNTLAVSGHSEDSGATGIDGDQGDNSEVLSGAVYVFTRTGSAWSQQAYLKASNTEEFDWFGLSAVSLSDDGNTLAVGALSEDSAATGVDGNQQDNSAFGAGAVYVFTRTGSAWSQQAYLKASNNDANDTFGNLDNFGSAVSLSADGNTLAVGAAGEGSGATGVDGDQQDKSADGAGAAYLFTRTDSLWSQKAYLKASNTDAEDSFGNTVSLSADGNTLAVGAVREDSGATGLGGGQGNNSATGAGAVYLY